MALGIVAAVGASLLYNASIALQALEVREVPGEHSLRPSLIGKLVRNRRWLGATGLGLLGWPLEIGALLLAPLTVVQPCLASGLILLLWLGATRLGERPGPREWTAVGAIVLGVAGVALAAPERTTDHAGTGAIALALALVAHPDRGSLCAARRASDIHHTRVGSKSEGRTGWPRWRWSAPAAATPGRRSPASCSPMSLPPGRSWSPLPGWPRRRLRGPGAAQRDERAAASAGHPCGAGDVRGPGPRAGAAGAADLRRVMGHDSAGRRRRWWPRWLVAVGGTVLLAGSSAVGAVIEVRQHGRRS